MAERGPVPEIAVVIPARNAAGTIAAQLEAVARQGVDVHLVVVDSQSTDGTGDVARRYRDHFAQFDVVEVRRPGAATARNAGVKATTARYILFFDADDSVRTGCVEALCRGLLSAEVAVGSFTFGSLNSDRALTRAGVGVNDRPSRSGTTYVKVPSAVAAIRSATFRAVGGFDERYDGIGNEDGEFFFRVQRAGARVAVVSDALIEYRLRDGYWAMWKQAFRNGRGVGVMYRQYPDDAHLSGIAASPRFKSVLWGVTHLWYVLVGGERRRGSWVRTMARSLGFARGHFIDARRRLKLPGPVAGHSAEC